MYLANLSTTKNSINEKRNIDILDDDLFLNKPEETKIETNSSIKDNSKIKVISMIPVETIKKDNTSPIGGN